MKKWNAKKKTKKRKLQQKNSSSSCLMCIYLLVALKCGADTKRAHTAHPIIIFTYINMEVIVICSLDEHLKRMQINVFTLMIKIIAITDNLEREGISFALHLNRIHLNFERREEVSNGAQTIIDYYSIYLNFCIKLNAQQFSF